MSPNRERDPVAGLWTAISPPAGACAVCRALGVGVLPLLRNGSKSGSVRSWMIPGGSCMCSSEY